MARMTPEQARAFVAGLDDISRSRTPASRAAAARRTVLAKRGIRRVSFDVDSETVADMAQCRQIAGITNRQVLRQAVALLRIWLGQGMTGDGLEALTRLCSVTGADPAEVADFCYRFTLQEARARGRIAIE